VKTLGVYIQEQAGIRDRMFITGAIRTTRTGVRYELPEVYYPR
jgi:hypothetical protein